MRKILTLCLMFGAVQASEIDKKVGQSQNILFANPFAAVEAEFKRLTDQDQKSNVQMTVAQDQKNQKATDSILSPHLFPGISAIVAAYVPEFNNHFLTTNVGPYLQAQPGFQFARGLENLLPTLNRVHLKSPHGAYVEILTVGVLSPNFSQDTLNKALMGLVCQGHPHVMDDVLHRRITMDDPTYILFLTEMARMGNLEAQEKLYIAARYCNLGFTQETGRACLEVGAKSGHEEAQKQLYYAARSGVLGFNDETGRAYLEVSAKSGHVKAQECLYEAARYGQLGFDQETGRACLEIGAKLGHIKAQEYFYAAARDGNLGFNVETGWATLEVGANLGHVKAQEYLYAAVCDGNLGFDVKTGRACLEAGAKSGHVKAQEYLYIAARRGKLGFNDETGHAYLEASAKSGHVKAQEELYIAACYEELGFDQETGREYLEAGAKLGHVAAQECLYKAARTGILCEFDDETGREYLKVGAKAGNLKAQELLYNAAYSGGLGFNAETGLAILEEGAKAGHLKAREHLYNAARFSQLGLDSLKVCQYYLRLTDAAEMSQWHNLIVEKNAFFESPLGQKFVKQLISEVPQDTTVRLLESINDLELPNYQQWIGPVLQNTGRFPWLKLNNPQQQKEQQMAYALWLAVQK